MNLIGGLIGTTLGLAFLAILLMIVTSALVATIMLIIIAYDADPSDGLRTGSKVVGIFSASVMGLGLLLAPFVNS